MVILRRERKSSQLPGLKSGAVIYDLLSNNISPLIQPIVGMEMQKCQSRFTAIIPTAV